MAIKFVDIEPEDGAKPKRSEKADAPAVKREPDAEALKESVEPELPHAKPEPKKKKKKGGGRAYAKRAEPSDPARPDRPSGSPHA